MCVCVCVCVCVCERERERVRESPPARVCVRVCMRARERGPTRSRKESIHHSNNLSQPSFSNGSFAPQRKMARLRHQPSAAVLRSMLEDPTRMCCATALDAMPPALSMANAAVRAATTSTSAPMTRTVKRTA